MPLEEADSGSHWATRVFGALSLKLSGGHPLSLFLFSHIRIYLLLGAETHSFIQLLFKNYYIPGTAPVLQVLYREDPSLASTSTKESPNNQKRLMRN